MSHDGAARAPRFEGEDVSPTTERELRGWYSTGLAAEIFAVCGVGTLLMGISNHVSTNKAIQDHSLPSLLSSSPVKAVFFARMVQHHVFKPRRKAAVELPGYLYALQSQQMTRTNVLFDHSDGRRVQRVSRSTLSL